MTRLPHYCLCVVLALALASSPSPGAPSAGDRPRLALLLGAGASSVSGWAPHALDDARARLAYQAGLRLSAPAADDLALETGLLFSHRGATTESSWRASGQENVMVRVVDRIDLTYITVPLRLHVDAGSGAIVPYFALGPAFSVLLSANLTERRTSEGRPFESRRQLANGTERPSWCLQMALGVGFPVRSRAAFLELGVDLGLGAVATWSDHSGLGETRLRAVTLSAGFTP